MASRTLHSVLGHLVQNDVYKQEWIQERAVEKVRGLQHFTCEEKLGFFRLEKRIWWDLIAAFQ